MTNKKRVIVSLSDEAYKVLCDAIGFTFHFCDCDHLIENKSQLIELMLLELGDEISYK